MADNDNGNVKVKVEESVIAEEEKKSEECLSNSIKYEDFLPQAGVAEGTEKQNETQQSVSLKEFEKVKKELENTLELAKRIAADYENYKRRVAKEKEELVKFANEKLLREMLETADNLEEALFHAREASARNEDLVKGFEITVKGYLETLKRNGVTQLDMSDNVFDPNFHEAIGAEESDTVPAGHIIKVGRKGYMLKERLLRPALVVVSKGKRPADEGEKKAEESEDKEPSGTHKCIAEPEPENKDE